MPENLTVGWTVCNAGYREIIQTSKEFGKEDAMKAHAGHFENATRVKRGGEAYSGDVLAMKRCAEKIWNAISKYVVFDNDAIFKDPNWPYLWSDKK
jgi:hypothetical protein